jgi:hypothetical protein
VRVKNKDSLTAHFAAQSLRRSLKQRKGVAMFEEFRGLGSTSVMFHHYNLHIRSGVTSNRV